MTQKNKLAPDWIRLPGRIFENTKTGEILSRRQYDKRYGALAREGLTSYEQKAEKRRGIEGVEQLARPARGRKKLKETNPEARRAELEKRRQDELERKIEKVEKRATKRRFITPKKLTLRNFKKGKLGNKWRVALDYESIVSFINSASGFRGALGYTVGIEFINEQNASKGAATLIPLRDFSVGYSEDDFSEMIEYILEKSYIRPLNAIVYIALKKQYAEKNNK